MRWSQDCPSNLAVLNLLLVDGGFAITELLAFCDLLLLDGGFAITE